ncbi:uncharacterized protein [Euwallacea fornicatus]|uniref:uncharacterized protein n=1 Tax=Euwallacea fornicatus TaxID=995702 RepID=UPI00338F25AD
MESESVRRDKKEESSGGNVNSDNVTDEGTMPIKVREVAGAPEGAQSAGREGSDRAPDENIEAAMTETSGAPEKVARKKPKPKRKIHGGVKRELTPIRTLGDGLGVDAARTFSESEPGEPPANGKEHSSGSTSETVSRQGSFKKPSGNGRGSLSELAHLELVSLFNKTKKSLSSAAQRGRERFRKYERKLAKRSQSAPHKFVEELQESLEKVQHDDFVLRRKFSDSDFGGSTNGSLRSSSLQPPTLRHRRTFSGDSFTSPKIIEVLDPETSNVVQRKTIDASGRAQALALKVEKLKVGGARDFFENFQLHKKQFRRDYREIKTTFRKCCFELFLIVLFCGLGGVMFKFTEGSFEAYYKCGVKRVKRDFIDLLWTKSHNFREDDWKSFARRRLRQFEEELHSAHEAGMKEYSGMRSWSFLNGIVYSLTIVTTIGYGHMFPKTDYGRALTIVYALIGIPLFLIALTDFGKLFTRAIKFVWSFVRRLYYTGSCRKVRKTSGVDDIFKGAQNLYDYATFRRPSLFDPSSPQAAESETQTQVETPTTPAISNFEIDDEFNLPISVALFILVAYIFCGAVMYMVIEKWNFFEAFYFVFISMSTIGFGDYVPRDPVFMIGSIIYLVFGLALMSMCINVVQAKLSDTFKKASMKIGATMGFEVDEDVSIMTASPECIVEELKPVEVAAVDERTIANEGPN